MCDLTAAICRELTNEGGRAAVKKQSGELQIFRMSGPSPITPADLVKTLEQTLDIRDIKYRQIERKGLENYLKNEVGLKR